MSEKVEGDNQRRGGTAFFVTRIGQPGTDVRRRTDDVQRFILDPVLGPYGLKVVRADEDQTPGTVTEKIVKDIADSRLVVADVTGRSPNVYYELGIAHCRIRPVVLLIDNERDIPFDTYGQKHIIIGDQGLLGAAQAEEARAKFAESIEIVLAADFKPTSPVTAANLSELVAESGDATDLALASVKREIAGLRSEVVARSAWPDSPDPSPPDESSHPGARLSVEVSLQGDLRVHDHDGQVLTAAKIDPFSDTAETMLERLLHQRPGLSIPTYLESIVRERFAEFVETVQPFNQDPSSAGDDHPDE